MRRLIVKAALVAVALSAVPGWLQAQSGGHVVALDVGRVHGCALTDTGGVKCWGGNTHGHLGIGSFLPSLVSTPGGVPGLPTGVTAPSASARQAPRRPAVKKPPVASPPAPPEPVKAPEPPPPPPPPQDVKIVTAYTQAAQVSQNTTYLSGARQRVEFPGVTSLEQCDLQRTVVLNAVTKRYRVQPYKAAAAPPAPDAAEQSPMGAFGTGQPPPSRGGVIVLTTTLTDTLERQPMFGLEARRIRTVVSRQASGEACDKTPLRTEIDAWYVDLPPAVSGCDRPPAAPEPEPAPASDGSSCRDRVETRVVGDVTLGFPVKTVTTTVTGEGEKQQTVVASSEVTALEITRLEPELFDVPTDYVEAKSLAELAPALGSGTSLADALFGSTADGTSMAAPKRPGVIRIGVLEPINRSARSLPARALRQDLVGRFSKAPFEALPLSGSSAADIQSDAARLECDYILLTEIAEVKTSKGSKLGGMLKMASGGGPPKDSHEVKLAYRLFATSAPSAPKITGDAKASSGGFGVGSAFRLALFAGQMYMGFAGMNMWGSFGPLGGYGLGLVDPLAGMAGMGGLGPMGGAYFDPRAMAMSSMAMGLSGTVMAGMGGGMDGMPDQSDAEVMQVMSEAFESVAKSADDKLKRLSR